MRSLDNNTKAFLALVKGGLWESDVRLLPFGNIDFSQVLKLAEDQSVVGLVAAGLDHAVDEKPPKEIVLQFIGQALQLEQRNQDMIQFAKSIASNLRKAGIRVLLVKGPAIAQCYDRPLWRACGDIDLFVSKEDFRKADIILSAIATTKFQYARFSKSSGLLIDGWNVELHGTLRCGLSSKLVKETDAVQQQVFENNDIKIWRDGESDIMIPDVDSDLFLLFTHFVRHFYKEGVVIRQLCDWCRFLWTYHDKLDIDLLTKRLQRTGLMGEWMAFAALAVDTLGMPVEAMPLYSDEKKWHEKGVMILDFIMKGGFQKKMRDTFVLARIFPINTLKFLPSIWFHLNGVKIKERVFGDGN